MRDRGKGSDGDPRERAPSDLSTKTSNREGEARLSVVDGGAALDPRGETLHVSGLPSAREAVDVRGATLRSGREPPARVDVLGDTVDSGRHRAPEPAPTDALARTVDSGRGPRPGGIDRDLVFAAVEQRLLGRAAESVKLDRFVLLDRLGSGGMGVVYAAYDPKLDRKVALKLLHTGALSGTAQRRHSQSQLEREARAAAQLSHPNVVTVYDVGVVGDQVYLALEYVEGETLTAWLEGQERGWREIVAIFLGAADGLIAAHDAGVVHRDFKPDNVLLGGDGRPRVADFGLARTASGDGPSGVHAMISGAELGVSATAQDARADTMTAIGTIAGTPAYMSPEQFSGVEVGAASDQFSFCVALYEALFASRPFAGETIASLSASVLQGELSPPPRGHGVPTPIVRAIERGLATTPQDRFPSMRALRAALARELAPRRTAWAVGGLLTALLTGGGAAMALQPAAAPAPEDPCAGAEQALDDVWTGARGDALERRVAELNAPTALRLVGALRGELDAYAGAWTAMRRDACEDTHVRGEQSERLLDLRVACLDRHKLRLATLTEALAEEPDAALLERAVDVSHELGALEACADRGYLMNARGPAIAAELPPSERARFEATAAALERGWVLWRLGRHAQAATLAASALEAADALAQPWLTARALRLSGDVSEVTGKYDDAAAAFDRAVWAGVSAGDQESVAFALLSYADVSGLRRKDVAAARQALDRLEPLLAVVPSGPELRARALLVRGRVALAAGDDEEARALLEQALPALTAQLGEGHSITVNAAQELANALVHLGEHAAAVERFSQIIAAIAERHGEAHPQVISALTSRGVARGWLGQFAEGRADLERALELSRELHGARHPSVADALHNLGELHWKRRDYARARDYHAENLALRREVLDPGDPYIGFTLVSLGEIDLVTHEHARALAELQEARGIIEPRLGPDHPVTAFVDTRIAQVRLALGQRALAVPALEASLATLERGSNLEWRADAEFALARGLDERDRDRAVALARAALARYREVGDRTAAVQAEVSTWLEEHVD